MKISLIMCGIWLLKMTKTLPLGKENLIYEEIEELRKSFSVTVFPSGKVIFKTPNKASPDERKTFLLKKKEWIKKQQAYFRQFHPKQQSYTSGSDILYLGRHYQLIVARKSPERVAFAANKIVVYSVKPVQGLLERFLYKRAEVVFKERLNFCLKFFPELNSLQVRFSIRKMAKRWGSFQKNGLIFLNPELIKAPKRCIDYVIFHELCHHRYKCHSKEFFELLAQKCPNYQALKTELELKVLGI